ncbi:MAG: hypothetical protein ACR2H1_15460 [Limisphaerales bacterium]
MEIAENSCDGRKKPIAIKFKFFVKAHDPFLPQKRGDAEIIHEENVFFKPAPLRLGGLFIRQKREGHCGHNAGEGGEMIPFNFFAEIKSCKAAEDPLRFKTRSRMASIPFSVNGDTGPLARDSFTHR